MRGVTLKTIRVLKTITVVSWLIILTLIFCSILCFNVFKIPYHFEYSYILFFGVLYINALRILPNYFMPKYSPYYLFKIKKRKTIKGCIYLTKAFIESKKFDVFKTTEYSQIVQLSTRKTGKRQYKVDVTLTDGRTYTALVVSEDNVVSGGSMKLLVNDILGNEFSRLETI